MPMISVSTVTVLATMMLLSRARAKLLTGLNTST